MSNPSKVSLQLAAADADGYAQAQAPAAAGDLNLNGALVAGGVGTPDVPRRVLITAAADESGKIFTVYGTNYSGNPQSEDVVGPNAGTAATTQDFKTVTGVAINGAAAGNVQVGTNGVASTPWVLDNFLVASWNLSVAVYVEGTVDYTVEHTYDDPNTSPTLYSSMEPNSFQPPVVWPNLDLTTESTSKEAQYNNQPIFAHRLTINSGDGRATMQSIQSGISDQ